MAAPKRPNQIKVPPPLFPPEFEFPQPPAIDERDVQLFRSWRAIRRHTRATQFYLEDRSHDDRDILRYKDLYNPMLEEKDDLLEQIGASRAVLPEELLTKRRAHGALAQRRKARRVSASRMQMLELAEARQNAQGDAAAGDGDGEEGDDDGDGDDDAALDLLDDADDDDDDDYVRNYEDDDEGESVSAPSDDGEATF